MMFQKSKFFLRDRVQIIAMILISYIPLLLNDPGRVAADTKAYLYLDPFRLLERAAYMWQPELALGTVTHQNIGYLWPIGPFFALGDLLSIPDWIVQRLWLGSIILAAGLGIRWFLKTLAWKGGAVIVASLSYMLSPYLLNYIDRHSVILLPWAGLPWLMALTVRALRTPGWRHPALFGLVTLTIGGVNASSLLLVGLGPFIWLIWSGLDKSASWKKVRTTTLKIGSAFLATGLWWMAGLAIQAQYGLPTLRLTENYRVVSDAATSPELFRGLGYWYFYGQGRVGAWIEPSTIYTRWALPLSFALPLLGLLISVFVKFRFRGHLLALMFISMLIAIGSHPYDSPSFFGYLFREWTLTDAGLALRSTPRVLPLLLLTTALFLGAGIVALKNLRPNFEHVATILISLLIIGNLSPLWSGSILGENVQRPEEIPQYWHQAATHLDAKNNSTRVLEIPGSDFSTYRWGNSGDPLLPGLMDRPYVSRELIPLGTEHSAELVVAFDREIQEGRFEPESLAPLAQLMNVGDIVVRSDLQYERFRTPRPEELWNEINTSLGFSDPIEFGERVPNVAGPIRPMLDEHTLASPPSYVTPPPAAIFELQDQIEILHLADPDKPLVISGDAEGIVSAAAEGLLEANRPLLLSASYLDEPETLNSMITPDARLVITDSNRKAGQRWGTIRETKGYTERIDEDPLRLDLSDHRLDSTGVDPSTMTVSEQFQIKATASAYGNPVTFTAGDRPFHAIDSFPETAWTVGAFNEVEGEKLVLQLDDILPIKQMRFAQVNGIGQNRWITKIRVSFDNESVDLNLNDLSRSEPGQIVEFDSVTSSKIIIEILETDVGKLDYYAGVTGVGFSTIKVNDIKPEEFIRMPTDLLQIVEDDVGSELLILVSRERSEPLDPIRSDPEEMISRSFSIPWEREFELSGKVRLSTDVDSAKIDGLLGIDRIRLLSSSSISGDIDSAPRSAFDSNVDTAWRTSIGDPRNSWILYETDELQSYGNISLTYFADGNHSVPRQMTLYADNIEISSTTTPGKILSNTDPYESVSFENLPFDARSISITFDEVAKRTTMDWYSGLPQIMPLGIVDITGVPDAISIPEYFDSGCLSELMTLDNQPVNVKIHGELNGALTLETCDNSQLLLDAGRHTMVTTPGFSSGFDVDKLLLTSTPFDSGNTTASDLPDISTVSESRTKMKISVSSADGPFWLILGQSFSNGWTLKSSNNAIDSAPVLINGFANGWLINPAEESSMSFELSWGPQRVVWIALIISLVSALSLSIIAFRSQRDRVEISAKPIISFSGGLSTFRLKRKHLFACSTFVLFFTLLNLPKFLFLSLFVSLVFYLVMASKLPTRVLLAFSFLFMSAAAILIVIEQIIERHPRDFVWPLFFEDFHILGVVSVLFVFTAALTDLISSRYEKGSTN